MIKDRWLKIRSLSFSYENGHIFQNFNLDVKVEVQVMVVLGASGIGKSTLVKLIAGHLKPEQGKIEICGECVEGPSASRLVVFQDYCLFPWKTVIENVAFGLKCIGISSTERTKRSRELLANLRLENTGHLYPKELSGGMKQRVGLARALAVSPNLIIMDEPFNAVDSELKKMLLFDTTRLAGKKETYLIVITHDLEDAIFLGDKIIIIEALDKVKQFDVCGPVHPRPMNYLYSSDFIKEKERLQKLIKQVNKSELNREKNRALSKDQNGSENLTEFINNKFRIVPEGD